MVCRDNYLGLGCKNKYFTNFDAPDAHFDYSNLFSDAQVEKIGNPKKNVIGP
jgi:hypothetical protein